MEYKGEGICYGFNHNEKLKSCDLATSRSYTLIGTAPGGQTFYERSGNRLDDVDFIKIENARILKNNDEQLKNTTVEHCVTECLYSDKRHWCRSFDFDKKRGLCILSKADSINYGPIKLNGGEDIWDHYSVIKSDFSDYSVMRNRAIKDRNAKYYKNVPVWICAKYCSSGENSKWCRSFDYRKKDRLCILSKAAPNNKNIVKTKHYDSYAPTNPIIPKTSSTQLLIVEIKCNHMIDKYNYNDDKFNYI